VSATLPVVVERIARVSPLGVRFWDAASSRFVSDGLTVSYSWGNGTRRRTAVTNRASVYVLADLPGLRELEFGDHPALTQAGAKPGDAEYWGLIPGLARTYRIDVVDTLRRFLPFWFEARLPFRGLFEPGCGSALSPPAPGNEAVPLFSAPSRPAPAGSGVVRAELVEPSGAPAAWALLEVTAAGAPPVRGLADERGQVAVIVPYPEPSAAAVSPLAGGTRRLAEERWDVTVRCFYDRPSPPEEPPELCRVLEQAPAFVDLDASPPEALQLAFGRDLVLRTSGGSQVLVTPAASPP
jgi:hypothetical protein